MPVAESALRLQFFDLLFGKENGYICIASRNPNQPRADFKQKFFKYPDDLAKADEYIVGVSKNRDVYFCINLLNKPERTKANCQATNLVWADLDEVDNEKLTVQPQILIQSSENRYQGVWRLSLKVDAQQAEDYSKRIAYSVGADKSGWDLTQLLRVPFTTNFKYELPFQIKLLRASELELPPLLFETFPQIENPTGGLEPLTEVPNIEDLPPFDSVLYKYKSAALNALITQEPSTGDWSTLLWKLIHTSIEMGMSDQEIFVICRNSKCDKYDRDNRPATDLWRDILKARKQADDLSVVISTFKPLIMPELVSEPASKTFIDLYHEWGVESTDAIPDYHDLAAFMLLSCICANSLRLDTSYGTMVPNLWGLLLGDSTLTRKTTSQRMVMDILSIIDKDCIVATEGSAEGLLTSLEQRPNKTSVFFKDEVSGFFDSINRKDYLAGMSETLTALYDVPSLYTRRLRKEVIRIESPAFVFFGGGVKDKVYDVITENYVISGFLPRFLVVAGEADLSKLRRTGPSTEAGLLKRSKIISFAADMHEMYGAEIAMKIAGQTVTMPPRIKAVLSNEAWSEYGRIEEKMVSIGADSAIPGLALPTFERLSRSLLKMGMCLAASRQEPHSSVNDDGSIITVEPEDIVNAAWYVQKWGAFSIEMIGNAGKGLTEKTLDRILNAIRNHPGIKRSHLMQHYHLTKKDADLVLGTLEERMLVRKEIAGRGSRYWIAS